MCSTRQKEFNQFVKFVHRVLIRMCRTFMVCLWICAASMEYGIMTLFAKRAAIRQNTRIFTGKALQSLDCGALQDGALSRSAAHTEG